MRYFLRGETLFVRGNFSAVSTGAGGGLGAVSTIFNHTVPKSFDCEDVNGYLQEIVSEYDFSDDFFGLLTAVSMRSLCILSYEFITVFVTAGVSNPNPDHPHAPGTINIIITSRERLCDAALIETIITATEAKAHALAEMGRSFTGTTTDAVVVACEGEEVVHQYAGTLTEAGRRVYEAVRFGVKEALKRHEGTVERQKESFFVFSTIGGEHWSEWQPEGCPYYPCHFEGQCCDFCFCPLYPCKDLSLGAWIEASNGRKVWSCESCTLNHEPKVANYLTEHPEATLAELKDLAKKKKE